MPLRIVIDGRHIRDFGIGTYIRNAVRALARIDRQDDFVVIVGPDDVGELANLPANFRVVPYATPSNSVLRFFAVPAFFRRFKADVYHVPLNEVPFGMPGPLVVTVHDISSLLFERKGDFRHNLRLYQFRRGLGRAKQIIAVSGATKCDLQSALTIRPDRIRLIYNAPDPIFTAPVRRMELDERSRIMERYQINYPYLLYAGNIRPQKNIPRLIEAFAQLKAQLADHPVYSDLRLIIIGDEISKYPAVRHAVIQCRVEQCVRFLGFVPIHTLRIFYKSAAAFVFPSLYEGFGLPPLEAMASGVPVVTSNVSSLPEVVGDAAIKVDPGSVFEIARGMREALLDESVRFRLVERGYAQVQRFSWDSTAEQLLDTYHAVAARRH